MHQEEGLLGECTTEELYPWMNLHSIVDYEKLLMKKRTNIFTELKNPALLQEFAEFMNASKSANFIILLNLICDFGIVLPISAFWIFPQSGLTTPFVVLKILVTILAVVVILSGWILYASLEDSIIRKYSNSSFTGVEWLKVGHYSQTIYCITLVTLAGLRLTVRSSIGQCHINDYYHSWNCNPNASANIFPIESAFALMIIPFLFALILRETRIYLSLIAWLIVMASLIYTCYLLPSTQNITIVIFYAACSIVMILDSFKQHFLFFLMSRQLKKTIEVNQKMAAQNKATEMRHMIANVAHDLKTPLSSFMTGIDIISDDITECAERLLYSAASTRASLSHPTSPKTTTVTNEGQQNKFQTEFPEFDRSYLKSVLHGLQSCIGNIRNTNSFMLMTINRCLDYTKASNGLKLVPKNETIDLKETLRMPLQCMSNVQQRIQIELLAYDAEEICSHIITDKQWLQENILCLLSNAVKYSAAGIVRIQITKIVHNQDQTNHNTDNRRGNNNQSSKYHKQPLRPGGSKVPYKVEDEVIVIDPTLEYPRSHRVLHWTKSLLLLPKPSMIFDLSRMNTAKILPTARNDPASHRSSGGGSGRVERFSSLSNDREESSNSFDKRFTPHHPHPHSRSAVKDINHSHSNHSTTTNSNTQNTNTTGNSTSHSESNRLITEELMIEVIDTGIGMTEEAMKSLFNPFKQTQRLAGGTGLGLYSLAKRIEALQGQYGVHRREDGKQGSVFWFTIPYKADPVTASHIQATRSREEGSSGHFFRVRGRRGSSLKLRNSLRLASTKIENIEDDFTEELVEEEIHYRILVAEDTPSIAKMTTMMLKRQNHVTTVAENGQIVLDLLYGRSDNKTAPSSRDKGGGTVSTIPEPRYDVVLMDLQMPVMDGLEATRRIRAYEREIAQTTGRKIHQIVLGVSANSDYDTMQEAFQAGIDDFLPKPFAVNTFLEMVEKLQDKYG